MTASKPLFENPDDRDRYFGKLLLNEDSQFPPYGDAMEHAGAVRLGLFSDRAALKEDCLRVMAGEIRRRLNDGTPVDVSGLYEVGCESRIERAICALAHSPVSELAYRLGRMGTFLDEFRNCRARPEYELEVRSFHAGIGGKPGGAPEHKDRTDPLKLVNTIILELIPDWLDENE